MRVPKYEGYSLEDNGLLRYNQIIYVASNKEIQNLILFEAHRAVNMAHPTVKKMYTEMRPLLY